MLILRALKALNMRVFTTVEDLKNHIKNKSEITSEIGFVPTMGALHEGHMSLVYKCLVENSLVVVSIFVNPTQFDNLDDLDKYPRALDSDIELLKKKSKNIIVFAPSAKNLYKGDPKSIHYDFGGLENEMEGKFRVGHFNGVGTVLKLLFEAVNPNRVYLGEKDFQQLQIVKKMVEIEKFPIEVVGCEIYREAHGLAYSSRNERLTKLQRSEAKLIFETLSRVKNEFGTKSVVELNEMVSQVFESHELLKLEYFEIANVENLKTAKHIDISKKYRAFIAVFADKVRLIDNIALN